MFKVRAILSSGSVPAKNQHYIIVSVSFRNFKNGFSSFRFRFRRMFRGTFLFLVPLTLLVYKLHYKVAFALKNDSSVTNVIWFHVIMLIICFLFAVILMLKLIVNMSLHYVIKKINFNKNVYSVICNFNF